MKKFASAAISFLAVATCAVIGSLNGPQKPVAAIWYARLQKPSSTPSGPAVGVTWGILEILLVFSGYRLLQARPSVHRAVAIGGWGLTLFGLAGFPYLFFRERRLGSSTIAAAAMLLSAATSGVAARKADHAAAFATIPFVAWLGIATLLSEELWRRNPSQSGG